MNRSSISIFPFTDPQETEVIKPNIPLAKEYAYDFTKGDFKLHNSKLYLVEGKEALKIWIHKALITSRYREVIHTWDYGSEFEDKLIGLGFTRGLIKSEAERYVIECIMSCLSDYVMNLKDFLISFDDGTLRIEFIAETIYGEVSVYV